MEFPPVRDEVAEWAKKVVLPMFVDLLADQPGMVPVDMVYTFREHPHLAGCRRFEPLASWQTRLQASDAERDIEIAAQIGASLVMHAIYFDDHALVLLSEIRHEIPTLSGWRSDYLGTPGKWGQFVPCPVPFDDGPPVMPQRDATVH